MMDRPLPVPVNRSRARIKRYALTAAMLVTVVLGVGALPVVFLYFWMPSNEQASSQISAGGSSQPQQSPRHNKYQAVAFVDVPGRAGEAHSAHRSSHGKGRNMGGCEPGGLSKHRASSRRPRLGAQTRRGEIRNPRHRAALA